MQTPLITAATQPIRRRQCGHW